MQCSTQSDLSTLRLNPDIDSEENSRTSFGGGENISFIIFIHVYSQNMTQIVEIRITFHD